MYSQGKPSQNGQQQGQGQQPQMQPPLYYYPQAGQQQQQQQQQQYDYTQYHQQYQQYQQYQGYQQYQQYQQNTQQPQQTPLQSQLAAALAPISGLLGQPTSIGATASSLPPSYSTPLPPAKSKGYNNGAKKPYNNNSPLGQMQAQYQSSMQMGAAAASAATAALFAHGYAGNGTAGGASSSGAAGAQEASSEAAGSEWYSSYQTPTVQQRMAVTMASNGVPGGRPPCSQNKRPNNNNNNKRQGRNSNNNNQRGKQSQNQHQNQKQAAASSSTSVPEKETVGFHCDACDVTFHEEAKLKVHTAAHRTCPDCQYAASPSLVSEHRKLTHGPKAAEGASEDANSDSTETASANSAPESSTPRSNVRVPLPTAPQKAKKTFVQEPGLPKLPSLDTPEDIANWIAQRRRAWPTQSNIQKKELERQEMIAKGQIVEDKSKDPRGRDKRNKNNKNNNQNNRNQKRGQPGDDTPAEDSPSTAKKQKLVGDNSIQTTTSDGVVAYSSSTEQSDNVDEDEDEDMDPVKDAISSKDPAAMGKISLPADRQRPKKPCRYFMRGRCGKGDKCTYSHDPSLKNKTQNTNSSANNNNNKEVFRSRPSLLQMLLSSEIKQEKNVLLEAMRYMVENNFFDRQEPTGALVEEVAMESA